jgi:hypothetical protein
MSTGVYIFYPYLHAPKLQLDNVPFIPKTALLIPQPPGPYTPSVPSCCFNLGLAIPRHLLSLYTALPNALKLL